MHRDVVRKFVEAQVIAIAPIATHFSEYVWTNKEFLGHETSVFRTVWPEGPIDEELLSAK